MRKVYGIGETIFDIIFKDKQPVSATPGGSAFNAIISLGRAGVPCSFISETGDDVIGEIIRDFMKENGVDQTNIYSVPGSKSPVALAFLNNKNDANYVFFKNHPNDKLKSNWPEINADDIIIFGSFYAINPVIRNRFKAFLDYATSRGAILYYDINYRKSHIQDLPMVKDNIIDNLKLVDIFRGSTEDFEYMMNESDPRKAYERLNKYCKQVVVTDGGGNIRLFTEQNEYSYPIEPIKTVSTVGAGDNFNAGLVYALIKYDIRKKDIPYLTSEQWQNLVNYGIRFSANVCQSVNNSITPDFATALKEENK